MRERGGAMQRSWQRACLAFVAAATILGGTARGAVIAQYAFTGSTLNPTSVPPDVTAGAITGSPTENGQATSVLAVTNGIYPTAPFLAAARAPPAESGTRANVYFTFTVDASDGNELDLSNLTFNVARGGAATPRDYDIRSSLDGFATSLTGIVPILTERPTFTPVSVDLFSAAFQDLAS